MDGNYYDCIDCGTENCPCSLAETGDCIVCSRLSGKDFCDCDWKGVCVYNEFVQNGKKSSGIRGEQEMTIVRRDGYGEETTVLVLDCGRGFALKCLQPGSFLFLKKPKDHHFYSMPVSVLAAEPEKGRIHLAVRAFAAKSKHLLEEGETLTVRGVYPNGNKKTAGNAGANRPGAAYYDSEQRVGVCAGSAPRELDRRARADGPVYRRGQNRQTADSAVSAQGNERQDGKDRSSPGICLQGNGTDFGKIPSGRLQHIGRIDIGLLHFGNQKDSPGRCLQQ